LAQNNIILRFEQRIIYMKLSSDPAYSRYVSLREQICHLFESVLVISRYPPPLGSLESCWSYPIEHEPNIPWSFIRRRL